MIPPRENKKRENWGASEGWSWRIVLFGFNLNFLLVMTVFDTDADLIWKKTIYF